MATTLRWLEVQSARDLVRVDAFARRDRQGVSPLGLPALWSRQVLGWSVIGAALASMHGDGRVRERAVRRLAESEATVAHRMLAVRGSDHVEEVRALARHAVMARSAPAQTAVIAPVLLALRRRQQSHVVRDDYLSACAARVGAQALLTALMGSGDPDLRRFALDRILDPDQPGLDVALAMLPTERDRGVRRTLARIIADQADARTVSSMLLRSRTAQDRVTGLVRCGVPDLAPDDVAPLLLDASVLVRLWARRRWQELGHDPADTYRQLTTTASTPQGRALAYVGLAESGVLVDRQELMGMVRTSEPVLQRVGLRLLGGRATEDDVDELLALVFSRQSRVAQLAIDVLVRQTDLWTLDQLAEMKQDGIADVRVRAWRLHRGRGGWEATIADLELTMERDGRMAELGRRPLPPMNVQPSLEQKDRLAHLIPLASISRDQMMDIAFSPGLLPELTEAIRTSGWIEQLTT